MPELDPCQRQAAAHLSRLRVRLEAAEHSWRTRLSAKLKREPAATARAAGSGVYLWGAVGRGKTLLMDAFYESLHTDLRHRTHFYRFMRQVHAELRSVKNQRDPLERVAAQLAERWRVLCLDEFFVADIADAMLLAGLLRGLFERGVALVVTSNVPPRDLYQDGLQRQRFLPAIDLIERSLDVVHLNGPIDYRLRELERAPTYLDSALPQTEPQMLQRFNAMSPGEPRAPVALQIENRPLLARCVAPGMAWFEFEELCEGPRSQNDYIELARSYHTVFISRIPVFQGDDNAARRFIMLIDEFYDRGVNIVVSAAAAPDMLYRGERLRFEFARAASRLMEMQTQQYLGGAHRI